MKNVNLAIRQLFDYFDRDPHELLSHILQQLALEIGNEPDNTAYLGTTKKGGKHYQTSLIFKNGSYRIKMENQIEATDQIINHYEF